MSRKRLRNIFSVILGLILFIPLLMYVLAVDWQNKHWNRYMDLPNYEASVDEGSFKIKANNLDFMIRLAGWQNEGPTVVLLHGFPESSIMWLPLMNKAADNGYRVLAFDQRGYSPGAQPNGKEHYHIDTLVNDLITIVDKTGIDKFHLVGHDWGASVGWRTVAQHEDRVASWAALTIPHLGLFFDAIANDSIQKERSAYMDKIKIPYIPEFLYLVFQDKFYKDKIDIWTPEQIENYQAIQNEAGALTAMMNWYRAMDIEAVIDDPSFHKKINRPTLYFWGTRDEVVAPHIIERQADYINADYESIEVNAAHSLMQEQGANIIPKLMEHWSTN